MSWLQDLVQVGCDDCSWQRLDSTGAAATVGCDTRLALLRLSNGGTASGCTPAGWWRPLSHRALVRPPQKLATQREAVASAKVLLGAEVFHLVATSSMKKGDVLTVRLSCDMRLISPSRCYTSAGDSAEGKHSKRL